MVLASAALSLLASSLVFSKVLLPSGWIPSEVARTIHRAELLHRLAAQSGRTVLLFGSSVVLEGVDAATVEQGLPADVSAFNIAESNAGVRNLMVNMPLITAARPALLVCCLRRTQLAHDHFPEIPHDLLMGYAYAGYLDAGNGHMHWLQELLTAGEKEALPSGPFARLFASRSFFLPALEERLRHQARSDLRDDLFASNFRDPWRYTREIPADRLEMLVNRSREHFPSLRFDSQAPIAATLAVCMQRAASAGIDFLLVLTPENPRIQSVMPDEVRAQFDAGVEEFSLAHGARSWSVPLDLLSSDDFLDHCHPNARGRMTLSRAMAEAASKSLGG